MLFDLIPLKPDLCAFVPDADIVCLFGWNCSLVPDSGKGGFFAQDRK